MCRIWHNFAMLFLFIAALLDKRVSVNTAWRVLRLRMEERPPDIEDSCEYTEKVVADI